MIEPSYKRIAAMRMEDDGDLGVVWAAYDRNADTVILYDCCVFRREVLVVIAEGINARGRWIPIAWEQKDKDMADDLLSRGCKMLYDPVKDSAAMAEVGSRDIWERMRTGRLKVDKRLSEWADEYQNFTREGDDVPTDSFPLMTATRYAVNQLRYAKRQNTARKERTFPKVAII